MKKVITHKIIPTIEQLIKRNKFEPESEQAEVAKELFEEALAVASPKSLIAFLLVAQNENSVTIGETEITYPHVKKSLSSSSRVVAYITTCGTELEKWFEKATDPLEEYIADSIKLLFLSEAQTALREMIKNDFFPAGHLTTLNPGSLKEWPLPEQRNLFAMLGGENAVRGEIGVELTESFLMLPSKTVSGMFFSSDEKYENCSLCPIIDCPGRRAEYIAPN